MDMTDTAVRTAQDYAPAALVTGAGRRIGRAYAKALSADGWRVAVHYRSSAADAQSLCREIAEAGGVAQPVGADLGREEEAEALVARAVDAVGPLGLLINNASHFERDTVESADRARFDRHMQVNLRAPLILIQQFAWQLPPENDGMILNMLDQKVLNPGPTYITYGLSKAGLWSLTRTLARDLAPRIRVNGIGPGYMLPDPSMTEADFERMVTKQPLGLSGTPEQAVATLRYFLAMPSLTGVMLPLDGGQHLV